RSWWRLRLGRAEPSRRAAFYWVQACAKVRHRCPCSHINGRPLGSVPQAHVAFTCWPSTHIGISFFSGIAFVCTCLVAFVCLCTCPVCFACANPTDKAIASSVTAKILSIGFKTFPRWFLRQRSLTVTSTNHFCKGSGGAVLSVIVSA